MSFLPAAHLLFTFLPFLFLLLLPKLNSSDTLFLHLFHVILSWIFILKVQLTLLNLLSSFQPLPSYFPQLNSSVISPSTLWPFDLFCFSESLFSNTKQELGNFKFQYLFPMIILLKISSTAVHYGYFTIIIWETSGHWCQSTKIEMLVVHTYCYPCKWLQLSIKYSRFSKVITRIFVCLTVLYLEITQKCLIQTMEHPSPAEKTILA